MRKLRHRKVSCPRFATIQAQAVILQCVPDLLGNELIEKPPPLMENIFLGAT